MLEAGTLAEVRTLLEVGTSSYWESHYLFGRTSSQKKKTMGERSKDLIIINTVVPFLYTYGLHKADEGMCERAGRFLEELKAEDNHIIRSWSAATGENACIAVLVMNICGTNNQDIKLVIIFAVSIKLLIYIVL